MKRKIVALCLIVTGITQGASPEKQPHLLYPLGATENRSATMELYSLLLGCVASRSRDKSDKSSLDHFVRQYSDAARRFELRDRGWSWLRETSRQQKEMSPLTERITTLIRSQKINPDYMIKETSIRDLAKEIMDPEIQTALMPLLHPLTKDQH